MRRKAIFLAIAALCFMAAQGYCQKQPDYKELEKAVQDLKSVGFIYKLNPEYNEVFVSKALWDTATIDRKQLIGYVIAHYCAQKKKSTSVWVEIKDHLSGKKLAKYSQTSGLKVE